MFRGAICAEWKGKILQLNITNVKLNGYDYHAAPFMAKCVRPSERVFFRFVHFICIDVIAKLKSFIVIFVCNMRIRYLTCSLCANVPMFSWNGIKWDFTSSFQWFSMAFNFNWSFSFYENRKLQSKSVLQVQFSLIFRLKTMKWILCSVYYYLFHCVTHRFRIRNRQCEWINNEWSQYPEKGWKYPWKIFHLHKKKKNDAQIPQIKTTHDYSSMHWIRNYV